MTTPQDGLAPAPPGRVACGFCGAELSIYAGGEAAAAPCPTCARILDLAPFLPDRAPPPPEPEPPPLSLFSIGPKARAPLMVRQDAQFPMPSVARCVEAPGRLEVRLPDKLDRLPIAASIGAAGLLMAVLFVFTARAPFQLGAGLGGWVAVSGYLVLQALLNWRVFRVEGPELRVLTGPLPWLRGGVRSRDVRALVVERNWTSSGRNAYRFIWELYARTGAGEKLALLENCSDAVCVGWLAQRLAAALGVPVEPAADPAKEKEQGP